MPTSKPTKPTKKPKSRSPPKPKSAKRSISVSAKKTNCSPQIGGVGSGDKKQQSSSRYMYNIPYPSRRHVTTDRKTNSTLTSVTRRKPKSKSIINTFLGTKTLDTKTLDTKSK